MSARALVTAQSIRSPPSPRHSVAPLAAAQNHQPSSNRRNHAAAVGSLHPRRAELLPALVSRFVATVLQRSAGAAVLDSYRTEPPAALLPRGVACSAVWLALNGRNDIRARPEFKANIKRVRAHRLGGGSRSAGGAAVGQRWNSAGAVVEHVEQVERR